MNQQSLKQFSNILNICFQRMRLYRTANLVTVLLLTATLSIPALFWSITANLSKLSHQWYNSTEVTAYLKTEAQTTDINTLLDKLSKSPNIAKVRYISPEEGLKAMSQQSNLGALLDALPGNPLPGVIAIELKPSESLSEYAKSLQAELNVVPFIETVQLDSVWLQRLQTILGTFKRLSALLAIILAIGVILIVSNSIQLTLERHRHEIAIYQLLGANRLFIRAPFLIAGLLIGLIAGLLTWAIVSLMVVWLSQHVGVLAALYQSDFQLTHFGFIQGILLLFVSSALGTVGAVVASRHYG